VQALVEFRKAIDFRGEGKEVQALEVQAAILVAILSIAAAWEKNPLPNFGTL
jgi:hypothetical protein